LVDLADRSREFTARAYDDLLVPTFRPSQLESRGTFCGHIASGRALGLALLDPDGTPISMIAGYPYPAGVLLIGYLATRPGYRGRAWGAELLARAREAWFDNGEFGVAVAEVDDPAARPGRTAERGLRFYERHDARLVARPYFQPRLEDAGAREFGLLLLSVWWRPEQMRDGAVPSELFVSWLKAYFTEEEGVLPDDTAFADLLRAYAADTRVPLLAIGGRTERPSVGGPSQAPA
jgi:GNAT superfamily N-acetyltransferase